MKEPDAGPATRNAPGNAAESPGSTEPEPAPVVGFRPKDQEPAAFWNEFFRTHPAEPSDLLANLYYLRQEKKWDDVESALRAYIFYRARPPLPWMYEMLAVAMEMNGKKEESVSKAFNIAADQALKLGDAVDLSRIADELAIHKQYARSGELLDKAMELDPSLPQPVVMSLELAEMTTDPDRMGRSVERLLSLGWPGTDEVWRTEARKKVEDLAKVLRASGREDEARSLVDRLSAAEARDLCIRLTWKGDADLDLEITEPLGATAKVASPRTVFGGAIVKNGYGTLHPEELYTCPLAFTGDYSIAIRTIYNNKKENPARDVTLEIITHEGTAREQVVTHSIDLNGEIAPIVVHLDGGRRTTVLPYKAPTALSVVESDPGASDGKPKQEGGRSQPVRPSPSPTRSPSLTPGGAAQGLKAPSASSGSSPINPDRTAKPRH